MAALILEDVTQGRKDRQLTAEEKALACQRLQQFAGTVSGGNPNGSDNEQIDKDLGREYLNSHEDES